LSERLQLISDLILFIASVDTMRHTFISGRMSLVIIILSSDNDYTEELLVFLNTGKVRRREKRCLSGFSFIWTSQQNSL
jgi:hypothetical protein